MFVRGPIVTLGIELESATYEQHAEPPYAHACSRSPISYTGQDAQHLEQQAVQDTYIRMDVYVWLLWVWQPGRDSLRTSGSKPSTQMELC
jgi:hypothetical protein